MEMWSLDDTGRDSWDWVGPLTWESMLQLPRVGWRLLAVKTEPLQIGLLWLLLLLLLLAVVAVATVATVVSDDG